MSGGGIAFWNAETQSRRGFNFETRRREGFLTEFLCGPRRSPRLCGESSIRIGESGAGSIFYFVWFDRGREVRKE